MENIKKKQNKHTSGGEMGGGGGGQGELSPLIFPNVIIMIIILHKPILEKWVFLDSKLATLECFIIA